MEKIKYLTYIIDKDGRSLDLERASAIKDMPTPENVSALQSFLGLANYYQVFIPNMHNLRAPLNELVKKDKDWDWTPFSVWNVCYHYSEEMCSCMCVCYSLAKCCCKISENEEDEDAVSFYMKGFNGSME